MTLREQIEALDVKIEWRLQKMREHTEEIKKLRSERQSFHRDSGMLPFGLLPEYEQDKINRMPLFELACEFCGSGRVKKGKDKIVCLDCGHLQGGLKREEIPA